MKILVFLQGTTTMHQHAVGHAREERVRQSMEHEEGVYAYESYVPIGGAVQKLQSWKSQGAEIMYLSSNQDEKNLKKDRSVLGRYNFPEDGFLFRRPDEKYTDVVEREMPDVLIEDDCESIGGTSEIIYPNLAPEVRDRIKSIIVKEFEGIDHLPDKRESLLSIIG